ncbi:hypothetical protein BV22DRAFT_1037959 [Leucogyrophana mollusca]|uniref:Uncharacterized protein n=1 Tax=Leucogyrophana mollusca TaxID=85980 RepID=A0ACB8B9L8_9AGAM|nr:hypothetical protein BV22DRAFT_1037959 [Leucogyrophana mollusca]
MKYFVVALMLSVVALALAAPTTTPDSRVTTLPLIVGLQGAPLESRALSLDKLTTDMTNDVLPELNARQPIEADNSASEPEGTFAEAQLFQSSNGPSYGNVALLQGLLIFGATAFGIILIIIAVVSVVALRRLKSLHRSTERLKAEMQLQLEFFVRNQDHLPAQLRKVPSKALSTFKGPMDRHDAPANRDAILPLYEGRHIYACSAEK